MKRDERGVASTVGTIMALLVFMTFLSLFTNSYVPVWMADNERQHMNTVMDQFGDLKSKVDSMVVAAEVTGRTDLNMFAPITLGASGIPVFASPTASLLTYAPYGYANSSIWVNFTYNLGSKFVPVHQLGGGMLQLYAPNRYYVEQWVTYENGAILVKQTDGQIVRAVPSISVQKPDLTSKLNVSWLQVDFVGINASQAGTGTAGLNIDLIYFDSQTYDNGSWEMNVTITMKTLYGKAWVTYLDQYFSSVSQVTKSDYELTYTANFDKIILRLNNTGFFTYNRAITSVAVQTS